MKIILWWKDNKCDSLFEFFHDLNLYKIMVYKAAVCFLPLQTSPKSLLYQLFFYTFAQLWKSVARFCSRLKHFSLIFNRLPIQNGLCLRPKNQLKDVHEFL